MRKQVSKLGRQSAASRAQRPHEKTAQRREDILAAAMMVFGSRGYNSGSLAEIAQGAGMTQAGVLHYFGSKEQLLIALLEYRDAADVANLEGKHVPRGADFLKHLILTAKENMFRPGIVQAYAVLCGESVTEDHPAQQFFRDRFAGLREMLVNALALITERAVDDDEIMTAASAIIAVMDGLQVQWLLDADAIDMPAGIELVIESVLARLVRN